MKDSIILRQTEVLEKMFDYFNHNLFGGELVDVALTIQSRGRKLNTLGWCSVNEAWVENNDGQEGKESKVYREINLSSEFMNRGIQEVAATLIHEMVHAFNLQNGIKDCNPKTQNHNKNFKEKAEEVGLVCERVEKKGYAHTYLGPQLIQTVDELVEMHNIPNIFTVARVSFESEAKKVERKPRKKYVCGCGISFSSAKDINACCNVCGENFEVEE